MKNRGYFFDQTKTDRFSNKNKPTEQTFKDLLDSIVFFEEDSKFLIPQTAQVGEVLYRSGTDSLGNPIYGFLDISDYVKEGNENLLPFWKDKPSGYILMVGEDLSGNKELKWIEFPQVDLSVYYTKTESDNRFVNEDRLYNISGQTNNRVATIDNVTNRIPEELVPMRLPERFIASWNANTNTPNLFYQPIFASDGITIIGQRTVATGFGILQRGDYFVVSEAGTQFGINFLAGEAIISNGTNFYVAKRETPMVVNEVNGLTGFVQLDYLRDGNGDLFKSEIDDHIADTYIHVQYTDQTWEGNKEFLDGISTDNIYSSTGSTIIFNDHIAFSTDPAIRVNEINDTIPLSTGSFVYDTYSDNEIATTRALLEFIEKNRYWNSPVEFNYQKVVPTDTLLEQPTMVVKNDFTFLDTTLNLTLKLENDLEFIPINVATDLWARFDVSQGYTTDEIAYIAGHLQKINIVSGTDRTMPLMVNKGAMLLSEIPLTLLDSNYYFGNNITVFPNYVAVDILKYNPLNGNLESVKHSFNELNTVVDVKIKPFWYDMSIVSEENSYFSETVFTKNLKNSEDLETKNLNANYAKIDITLTQKPKSEYIVNNVILANAEVLEHNTINVVNPQLTGTFIKLPNMDSLYEGAELKVANLVNNESITISVFEPLRDQIIFNSMSTPTVTTQVVLESYEILTFTAVRINNLSNDYKWMVK